MKAKSDVGAIFEIPAKAQVKFQIQMWARWEASASEISTGRGRVGYIWNSRPDVSEIFDRDVGPQGG